MKNLMLLLITLLGVGVCIPGSAQRYLQVSPHHVLDTKGAMTQSPKYHFDEYGFLPDLEGPALNARIFKVKDKDTVAILISQADFEHPDLSQRAMVYFRQEFLDKGILAILEQSEGMDTPYGRVLRTQIVPPGSHSIHAHNKELIRYAGHWTHAQGECLCAYSNQPNAYFEIIFNGTGIRVMGEKLNTHGVAAVSLDGQDMGTVDLYAPDIVKPEVIYKADNLPRGQHVLRLTVTGQRNLQADNHYVVMTHIEIENRPDVQIIETVRDSIRLVPVLPFEYDSTKFEMQYLLKHR